MISSKINVFSDILSLEEIKRYSELYQLSELQQKLTDSNEIILIHQMGKVGSSSIYNSLKDMKLEIPIVHTHYLNYRKLKSIISHRKSKELSILRHLIEGVITRNAIDSSNKKLKIITLTREPIGRNISAFFENRNSYIPNCIQKYRHKKITIPQLCRIFINKFPHYNCLNWIDSEIKQLADIDVYKQDFDICKGYQIYQSSSFASLLLIKLEYLNDINSNSIKSFLGIEDFKLANSNLVETKKYHDIYKKFKKEIAIPKDMLDKIYASKYTSHFYSEIEINALKNKWLKHY